MIGSNPIKSGPTKVTNAKGTMTTAPRSFADFLAGRSTTTYTRPTKAVKAKTAKAKTAKAKAYKPTGPTSNGIGVGP